MTDWRDALARGEDDAVRAFVRSGAPASEVAQAAEAVGDARAAVAAWRRHLGQHPGDQAAQAALAALRDDLGDDDVGDSTGDPPGWPEDIRPPAPTDADCVRFAALFAGREEVHAVMWRRGDDVGYGPVRSPITPERVARHLAGDVTLGAYGTRADGRCPFLCFDFDLSKDARAVAVRSRDHALARWAALQDAARHLVAVLRGLGLDPVFEASGSKGLHVWLLLPTPTPAPAVRAFATGLLERLGGAPDGVTIEVFPKQDRLPDGAIGNLVKLPLGRHLGSGRFSQLLDDDARRLDDPHARLRDLRRLPLPDALPEGLPPFPGDRAAGEAARAPVPVTPERPFTEADFETSPTVGPILRGCPVLAETVARSLRTRALSRDAAMALEHTLGHTGDGVRAVNYLLDAVPGTEDQPRMGAPLRGSPMSCKRVRQRLPDIADEVGCDCRLQPRPGGYPTPLLYLDGPVSAPREAPPTLDELFASLAKAEDHLASLRAEVEDLRVRATRRLQEIPGHAWRVPGGSWVLEDADGLWVLRFEPVEPFLSLLVLAESDLRLHADGTAVVVERGGRPVHAVPVHEVSEVHLYGGADLSVGARNLLLARGVDVLLLTLDGRYRGRLVGAESAWSARRVAQYRLQTEPERRLSIARSIVAAKIEAHRTVLTQRQRQLRSERVAGASAAMRAAAARLPDAADLDAVRGLEGLAARRYFEVWDELLRTPAFTWTGRNRRPPKDPPNACLSFGYTLLVLRVETAVRRAGLDPHLGVLHGGSRGAPSVALDLAEPYRPLVDTLVLTLLNRRELAPDDFDRPPAAKGDADPLPDDAVYLGKIGREIFLRAWHRQRAQLRAWPGTGPERTLDQALDEDAHRLRRFVEGHAPAFVPVAADGSHPTPTDEEAP